MPESMDDRLMPARQVGASIGGELAGTATGAALGGPLGLVAGSVVSSIATDALSRLVSRREKSRIHKVVDAASRAFDEIFVRGDKVRADGFFDSSKTERSPAEELVEGVLIVAQRTYEERKIEYLGYLIANIACSPMVDVVTAGWLLGMAEALSWPQYVVLAAVGRGSPERLPDVAISSTEGAPSTWASHSLLAIIREMGFAGSGLFQGVDTQPKGEGYLPVPSLRLREQRPTSRGRLLHDALALEKLPWVTISLQLNPLRTT